LFEEKFQPAREFLTEAVEVAERLGDTTRLFFSLQNLGWAQEALKQLDTALQTHQRALKIAEDESNHRWKALALHSIAEDYHAKDDREKAQEHYDKALKLYQKLGVTAKADELTQFLEKENYIIPTK
jgi:tetratricopeptide (TPR) repeat protein